MIHRDLFRLISALDEKEIIGDIHPGALIREIESDSRKVQPGDLFVAYKGVKVDGHDYIPQAVDNGAVAVVCERVVTGLSIPLVVVPNARKAISRLAAAHYGFPANDLMVMGITGTDGKTTTASYLHSILASSGVPSGLLSTINVIYGDVVQDIGLHVTTPTALEVQEHLRKMVDAGMESVVIETTSHGLDQHRVDDCYFDTAIITNVSHEHLDYHTDQDSYNKAKYRLFQLLSTDPGNKEYSKISILNVDDPSFQIMKDHESDDKYTYAVDTSATFRAENISYSESGTEFSLIYRGGEEHIKVPMIGKHNVYNVLGAIAGAYTRGISIEHCQQGISTAPTIQARLEPVDFGQDFKIFLDYAHTPNGLKNILKAVRNITEGKLILVFGLSGGPRDKSKRPLMGEIASSLADEVVITAVDWYAEQERIESILSDIAAGCEAQGMQEGKHYWKITSREKGIAFAINLAEKGDIVVIAGKGHEDRLNVGDREIQWSEYSAIEKAVRNRVKQIK